MLAIGLMSGTSMDGIDVAAVETDGADSVTRGPSMAVPYEAAFRRRIEASLSDARSISTRSERPGDLAALEREITMRHAAAVRQFLARENIAPVSVSAVGFHGQTVLHRPGEGLTVQLGDGALLARETGLQVVWDMRANDMVHGGQGAPLVPAYHAALVRSLGTDPAFPVMVVNIGGISNVSWIPQSGDPHAFDCGPGNALIDQWVQAAGIPFDDGGSIGSEGSVVGSVVDAYLAAPFLARRGPKSLDRNDFTVAGAAGLELADGARTLARLTAKTIAAAGNLVPEPPRTWIICGGGRKNANIINDLRELVESGPQSVLTAEQAGLDGDATEAEAWAYLAVRSLEGLPLTFPTTTGCRKAVSGGIHSRP